MVPRVAVALCAEAQMEEAAHTEEAARWAVVRSQEEAAAQTEFWWAEAREEEAVPAPADRQVQPVAAITCTCNAGGVRPDDVRHRSQAATTSGGPEGNARRVTSKTPAPKAPPKASPTATKAQEPATKSLRVQWVTRRPVCGPRVRRWMVEPNCIFDCYGNVHVTQAGLRTVSGEDATGGAGYQRARGFYSRHLQHGLHVP